MTHILSLRLAALARGFEHAADTGAYISASEAKALHEALQACAALAREMEMQPRSLDIRGSGRPPFRFLTVSAAEADMRDRMVR